jgi:hypothetical protein
MRNQHFGACGFPPYIYISRIQKLSIDLDLQSSLFYCAFFSHLFSIIWLFSFFPPFQRRTALHFLKKKKGKIKNLSTFYSRVLTARCLFPLSRYVMQQLCGSGLKFLLIKTIIPIDLSKFLFFFISLNYSVKCAKVTVNSYHRRNKYD